MKVTFIFLLLATSHISAQRGPPSFVDDGGPFGDQLEIKIWDDSAPIIFDRDSRINPQGDAFVGNFGRSTANVVRKKNGSKGIYFASIVDESEGMIYQISPDASGVLTTRATRSGDFDPELDPPNEDISEGERENNTRKLQTDDGSVLDVMVLWTKKAECLNSGLPKGCSLTEITRNNMQGLVDLAVLETNVAFTNSGVLTQLRLVHSYRDETFDEDRSTFSKTLSQLTDLDGVMDDVHKFRELYGADIVSLLIDDDQYCGIAWVGPSINRMFSVTKWSCATGYFTFGHEIGHNLGCNHDKGTKNACSTTNYNYGWRDPQARFRSVLAYNCVRGQCDNNAGGGCTRVQRFSNDQFLYNGLPMGNIHTDNARQINDVKARVASYFTSKEPVPSMSPSVSQLPTTTPVQSPSMSPSISRSPTKSPTQKPVKTRPTKPPKNSGPGPGEKPTKPPKTAKGQKIFDFSSKSECLQKYLRTLYMP